jgi:hypothetical protein
MIALLDNPPTASETHGSTLTRKPTLLFAIPPGDESKFFATRLSDKAQVDVRSFLHAMDSIHRQSRTLGVVKACQHVASLVEQKKGKHRGWDAGSLRRKYYAYVSTGKKDAEGEIIYHPGDWRILWDQAKYPENKPGLPFEFIELWRYLCEKNQRVCSVAHLELKKIFNTHFDSDGKHYTRIPGYSTWPERDTFTDLPAGWTYENLMRHRPTDWQLKAAQVGLQAAAQLRLPVLKTRVGLRVGEFIQFDDHEFNLKVNVPGQRQAMRPRSFAAADVLSACFCKYVFKATLWDEDAEKKRVLSQRDFMWFLLDFLFTVGFRNDERGTTFVLEHGTANIPQWLEDAITLATGGKVKVVRSGRFGKKAHGGQHEVAAPKHGPGNFHFKGLLESSFSVVDNFLASRKGQVGKDRNHSPEQLWGAEAMNKMLLAKASDMSPERAALLQFPFLLWHEFKGEDAFEGINDNCDHNLEGWDKLKFYAKQWRRCIDDPWKAPEALAQFSEAEQRDIANALMTNPEILLRARKLSRREVFRAGASELTTLPWFQLPAVLNFEEGLGKEIPVRNGLFTFEDQNIGPGEFQYPAINGRENLSGKFLCFFNPLNPSKLVVCTSDKKVVTVCDLYQRPCYNDAPGIQEKMGLQNQWVANERLPMEARHADDAAKLQHMQAHNEAVIAGQPVTAEEKAEVKRIRENAKPLSTFLGAAMPATEEPEEDAQASALSKLK